MRGCLLRDKRLAFAALWIIHHVMFPIEPQYVLGDILRSYQEGERVDLMVNKMTSSNTLLPIEYYQMPFCRPINGPKQSSQNLGQFLAGDRIQTSPYELKLKVDMFCKQVCISNLGREQRASTLQSKTVRAIQRSYHNNWIVDNLPAASKTEDDTQTMTRYWQGFPIGFWEKGKAYIYNHVNIEIEYHSVEAGNGWSYRILRFTVEPFSIKYQYEKVRDPEVVEGSDLMVIATIKYPIASCAANAVVHTNYDMVKGRTDYQEASGEVLFTYDVIWKENTYHLSWASRWDVYVNMDNQIPAVVHWYSIVNSLIFLGFISCTLAAALVRSLKSNDLDDADNGAVSDENGNSTVVEQSGNRKNPAIRWCLVHADVFRPPTQSPLLLAVCCGSGAQLLTTTLVTVSVACFGMLHPSRRGYFLIGLLLIFALAGIVNGYITATLYQVLQGSAWREATMAAALLFPGLCFSFYLLVNLIALVRGSSLAVPLSTLLTLILLWGVVAAPLVYLGAHVGRRRLPNALAFPVVTSKIPRQIPNSSWRCTSRLVNMAAVGFIPMGCIFVELYYIQSAIWMEYYYNAFGFLLLVIFITVVTVAELSVLLTYYSLCQEDHRWWWKSFCAGGSIGLFIAAYSIIYYQQLEASSLATFVLYFGYMSLISLSMFIMMGFVGLSASLWLNHILFRSIVIQ